MFKEQVTHSLRYLSGGDKREKQFLFRYSFFCIYTSVIRNISHQGSTGSVIFCYNYDNSNLFSYFTVLPVQLKYFEAKPLIRQIFYVAHIVKLLKHKVEVKTVHLCVYYIIQSVL